MSASDKPDLARGWLRAMKLVDDEADRLATMSDEDFEREMRALPEPAHVPTANELLARGEQRVRERQRSEEQAGGAVVKSLPHRRWITLLVAAALCVMVVFGMVNRRQIVAWFTRDSMVAPDDWQNEKLVRQERVDALRREGFEACAESMWTQCEGKLDEAKRLDPAGEADPRVRAARKAIDDARHPVRERPTTPDSKK